MGRPSLFVTGMQRSGTTLLEKILSTHGEISLLSQPFPFLFIDVKREFFHRLGLTPPPYPLGPLFLETRYSGDDLARFLAGHVVARPAVEEAFAAMEGFSGQYTKFDEERLEGAFRAFQPGDLTAAWAQLCRLLAHAPETLWLGSKETLCEEFLPFLLDRGVRALVILRDPRDILASLNHGEGRHFAGRPKPTLFNIRNWRKSVAFALHLESHPNFQWLRYEDLVSETDATLERITRFLGISRFGGEELRDGIRGPAGESWPGNSSHGRYRGVSRASVGRFESLLPAEVRTLVEITCHPELLRLGYPCPPLPERPASLLESLREPYPMSRQDLADHLLSPRTVREELARLELLRGNATRDVRSYFLFEDVYRSLRSVFDR